MGDAVNDMLFSPLTDKVDWRVQCREIVRYIYNHKFAPNRRRQLLSLDVPAGVLRLEGLCELFHKQKQEIFWLVYVPVAVVRPVECREIYFNGVLIFDRYENGGYPYLASASAYSIRDLNLVENIYTDHYVFATRADAEAYWKEVAP